MCSGWKCQSVCDLHQMNSLCASASIHSHVCLLCVCLLCVLGVESFAQLSEFSHRKREIEGTNMQQISGITVLITQQSAKNGILSVHHAQLRPARCWPCGIHNAGHNQPRVSHKQKIRVSYVPWEKKPNKNGGGSWRHPLTWPRAYCVLLINAANKPITENICVDNVLVFTCEIILF